MGIWIASSSSFCLPRRHRRYGNAGWSLTVCVLLWGLVCVAQGTEGESARPTAEERAAFVERVFTITDLVLDQHIDPPTRQQMLLAGIRALLKTLDRPLAAELARRVSDIRDARELGVLLDEVWPGPAATKRSVPMLEQVFLEGALSVLPGNAQILTTDEVRVNAQIAGDRYVGIGITLSFDEKHKLPVVGEPFAGGPAATAGMKKGDLIEQVDGTSFANFANATSENLKEYLAVIRGEEGTEVTVHVRQPDSGKTRVLKITRAPLQLRKNIETEGEKPPSPIGYLKVQQIGGSTVHELRTWEEKLRATGIKALILDLRSGQGDQNEAPHAAMLLADSLVEGRPLAKLRTRQGTREFVADGDRLFRDWPLAILIDSNTSGPAEWVAGALQDAAAAETNPSVVLVGAPTRGQSLAKSTVYLPSGKEALVMATGVMERVTTGPHPSAGDVQRRLVWRGDSGEPIGSPVIPDITLQQNERDASFVVVARAKPSPPSLPPGAEIISGHSVPDSLKPARFKPSQRGDPMKIAIEELKRMLQEREQAAK